MGFEQEKQTPIHRRSNLTGLRVLIVDDHATNRFILEEYLGPWGVICTSAMSGEEALQRLGEIPDSCPAYDVVILDGHMSETDGATMVERIRAEPKWASIKVIMLMSVGFNAPIDELKRALRIDGLLSKPIRQSQLLDGLQDIMTPCDGQPE